jgi:hypothetical protein
MEQGEILIISRKERGFAWVAAIFVSLWCIYICLVLVPSIGIFKELFKGLGVELPLVTRFFIATYIWLCPLLFVGAAVLVIAKELCFVISGAGGPPLGSFFGGHLFGRPGAVRYESAAA